jgi:hypothetical protein
MTVMSKVRLWLGATVGATLLVTGVGVAPSTAATREGSVTVTAGGYELTARVVVVDQGKARPHEAPVDIYLEHNGTDVTLDRGWVTVVGPDGEVLYAGGSALNEVAEGHLRAIPELVPESPVGDYEVSFGAYIEIDGEHGPVLARVGATNVVAFTVLYETGMELTARSANLPTGAVTTLAGTLGFGGVDSDGAFHPKAGSGATVEFGFDPDGPAKRRTVGSATVDDRGFFRLSTPVTGMGKWYAAFAGNADQHTTTHVVTQTARPHVLLMHQGTVARTQDGATAGLRLTTTDVITTLEPQRVRIDFGVTTYGSFASTYGVHLVARRGEGRYPYGRAYWPRHQFASTSEAGYIAVTMDELTPPGVYDVGADVGIYSCTKSQWITYPVSGPCGAKTVRINDDTITTLTVKRGTRISVAAASTSFTGPRTIGLKGVVRKLQLVDKDTAAYRLAANTLVKLYWDPAGPVGPAYRKTVYTNAQGTWSTTGRTTQSGRWIAKYPGSALSAPSQSTVAITVR